MNKKWLRRTVLLITIIPLITLHCESEQSFADHRGPSPLKNKHNATAFYQLQESFNGIADMYNDSVVFITTEKTVSLPANPLFNDPFFQPFRRGNMPQRQQKQTGQGTGFVISTDGYICTNHHVINGADTVKVVISGKHYTAKVIGSDPMTDVALLKIKGDHDFKPVYFGNSDDVKVGDWAIAIGNPFGLDRTFTVGVISGLARKDVDQIGNSHLQTDASINPGNSGGPLLDIDGEVIGVNRMIYSKTGGNLGIGFAIPINTAVDILDQLRTNGKVKRGYIGVQIAPLTEGFAKELGLKKTEGALVGSVFDDSPADKAGLRIKDVILQMGDTKIADPGDLIQAAGKAKIGKTFKFKVWRDGNEINLFVTVGERP